MLTGRKKGRKEQRKEGREEERMPVSFYEDLFLE
jgi:hypothetical protein